MRLDSLVRPAPHVVTADSASQVVNACRWVLGPAALDVSSPGYLVHGTWIRTVSGRPFLHFPEAVDQATYLLTDHHDTNPFRSTTFESSVRIGIATNAFGSLANTAMDSTKSTMGR